MPVELRILAVRTEPVRLSLYVKCLMAYVAFPFPNLGKIMFIRNASIWVLYSAKTPTSHNTTNTVTIGSIIFFHPTDL